MGEVEKKGKSPFYHTLNLPRTEFSIRANAATKEPEVLKKWEEEKLYTKAALKNKGDKKFILHDGPPFANGHLHMGHALNIILKDITCKSRRMAGYHTPFIPGWDCHGLPIELKVIEELGIKRKKMDRITFKKYCRDYANKWIKIQREEMKEMAKLADYDNAYITMSKSYEAATLQEFSFFVEKGHIKRQKKSIPWCASCQTVLAAAEIEYKDRKDHSIYVFFPLRDSEARLIFPYAFEKNPNLKIGFLVWTTTPWTLPLNRAIILNPTTKYLLLEGKESNQAFIVGKDLADTVCSTLNIQKKEICELDSSIFEGKMVEHPFILGSQVPIFIDDIVTVTEGTACLHCAPGCGPEDYKFGVKKGLEIFSPLSAEGKYTHGIKPEELEGMSITDGQLWVLKKLTEVGNLVHRDFITHSYPHCWRCHGGLMFRATKQWFCDLKKNNLIDKTLKEIENIKFVPDWGKNRLYAFVSSRTEWCISRQRVWGLPIPAILCECCDGIFISADFVRNVSKKVEEEGIEFWDRITVQDLISQNFLPEKFSCSECSNRDSAKFRKEEDILDVWFESGTSYYAVLEKDPENLGVPADLYLEGSDQHRGWFQSSLLCSMVINGFSPTREFLTHGYVVDEDRHKMSKSLGNVIAPREVIDKYSRDILRLWIASSDYEGDVVISDKLLINITEVYKKIRNTCRFLISNLYDFDMAKDGVSFKDMLAIDQYAIAKLIKNCKTIRQGYENYRFSTVTSVLNNYCTNDLSALYLDILKDRLYVERADGHMRRSAQTAIYLILDSITRLIAPVLSFLAEEVSDFYQKDKTESIHLQNFLEPVISYEFSETDINMLSQIKQMEKPKFEEGVDLNLWVLLEVMRDEVFKAIEKLRTKGIVRHSLEAKVLLYIDKNLEDGKRLETFMIQITQREDLIRFFKDWFIVSQVNFEKKPLNPTELKWLYVKIEHADGVKCPRCWQWEETDNPDQLCKRCSSVLSR